MQVHILFQKRNFRGYGGIFRNDEEVIKPQEEFMKKLEAKDKAYESAGLVDEVVVAVEEMLGAETIRKS